MKIETLKTIVGLQSLPEDVMGRIRLIKFADSNHVLGQMAYHAVNTESKALSDIFENAKLRASHDHTMLTFEMNRVERAFSGLQTPIVVLKGGAYVATGGRAGLGRRVSDLDILVQHSDLSVVEQQLSKFGWMPDAETDNEYDQQYYRQHMHELPPLRHRTRGTVIDVHHALLPKTARFRIDAELMFTQALSISGANLKVFSPIDQFIHSAVHAYADGALDTPARTLVEQYFLYSDLKTEDMDALIQRAKEVGAAMPVALALWLIGHVFELLAAEQHSKQLKGGWRYYLLKHAILVKLEAGWAAAFGKAYLYVRSHYLRMPLYLLLPHLIRKAIQWRPGSNVPTDLPFPQ